MELNEFMYHLDNYDLIARDDRYTEMLEKLGDLWLESYKDGKEVTDTDIGEAIRVMQLHEYEVNKLVGFRNFLRQNIDLIALFRKHE